MSYRLQALGCALFLGVGACSGDAFDAAGGDAGPTTEGDSGSLDPTTTDSGSVTTDSDLVTQADGAGEIVDGALVAPDGAKHDGPGLVMTDGSRDSATVDAPLGWCDGKKYAFCADFDRVNAVTDTWSTSNVTPGAALDFNLVSFTSPGRSLRSKVSAGTGPDTSVAMLSKKFTTALNHSILELDLNVASIGMTTSTEAWLLEIARLSRNDGDGAVAILAEPTGAWGILVASGQLIPIAYELPAPPKFGRFVRLTFDVVWSPTAGSVHIAFDGVSVLVKDGIFTAMAPAAKTIEAQVGFLDASGPTPPAEMSIDNLTLQLQ